MLRDATLRYAMPIIALALVACATSNDSERWTCMADGMVNSHYSGGDTAMIHLKSYSSGGHYRVTRSGDGTVANGVSADGTGFQCKKRP